MGIENELQTISIEIDKLEDSLVSVKREIGHIEKKQFEKFLRAIKSSFKFKKIVKSQKKHRIHSIDDEDNVEYYEEKGAFITEIVKGNHDCKIYTHKELWLTPEGKIIIYETTIKKDSNEIYLTRELSNDTDLTQFDFEEIIDDIKSILRIRIRELSNSLNRQQERLFRIHEIFSDDNIKYLRG